MSRIKHIYIHGLFLLFIIFFISCDSNHNQTDETDIIKSDEPKIKYLYSQPQYPQIIEPLANSLLLPSGCIELTLDDDIFYFAPDISDADKDNFIDNQLELQNYLKQINIDISKINLYVLDDYTNRTESEEGKAFYGINTSGTYNQILTTLQLIYGDYTNYGFLFAAANHIAGELSWTQDDKIEYDPSLIQFLRDNPEYLSLAYPCFNEVYSTPEAIHYSKMLALLLYENVNEQSETTFAEQAQIFTEENNIEYTPVIYKFAYNGPSCPLKLKTEYFELFRNSSYIDEKQIIKYADNCLTDYKTVLQTLQTCDNNIKTVRNIFNISSKNIVKIYLYNKEIVNAKWVRDDSVAGFYSGNKDIFISTFIALLHEYVHYIFDELNGEMDKINNTGWNNEVLAYYYGSRLSDFNHIAYRNMYNGEYAEAKDWFVEYAGKEYTDNDDYLILCELYCYEYNKFTYDSSMSWYPMFAKYFVDTYGEDILIDAMLHPSKVEELTGKSFDDILADCKNNLIAKYSKIYDSANAA
jgi:hypothetical protein